MASQTLELSSFLKAEIVAVAGAEDNAVQYAKLLPLVPILLLFSSWPPTLVLPRERTSVTTERTLQTRRYQLSNVFVALSSLWSWGLPWRCFQPKKQEQSVSAYALNQNINNNQPSSRTLTRADNGDGAITAALSCCERFLFVLCCSKVVSKSRAKMATNFFLFFFHQHNTSEL